MSLPPTWLRTNGQQGGMVLLLLLCNGWWGLLRVLRLCGLLGQQKVVDGFFVFVVLVVLHLGLLVTHAKHPFSFVFVAKPNEHEFELFVEQSQEENRYRTSTIPTSAR